MRKMMSRVLLSGMLLITTMFCLPVSAAKVPTAPKNKTVYFSRGQYDDTKSDDIHEHDGVVYLPSIDDDAKLVSIKSSNRNIHVYAFGFQTKYSSSSAKGFRITPTDEDEHTHFSLKTGMKATITLKIRQKNKLYTLKTKVTLKKLPKICTKLKIGNKDYANYFDGWTERQIHPFLSGKHKVTVKIGKQYKLKEMYAYYEGSSREKHFKNGAVVDFNNLTQLRVVVTYRDKIKDLPKALRKQQSVTGIILYNDSMDD